MAKKKQSSHCTIRNSNLFCTHCGQYQVIPLPIAIPMYTAMSDAFCKIHKDCKKVWSQPEADLTKSVSERMGWWWREGERGMSSESIYQHIGLRNTGGITNHPCDPDDFRRCYMLLKAIPEWKTKLYVMGSVSQQWKNLITNWDKLTEMLEEQMVTKKDNGMYDLMQTILK